MGRPPHRPTDQGRREVEAMAGYGTPLAMIAAIKGIDEKTLRKHYRAELDRGAAIAGVQLCQTAHQRALGIRPGGDGKPNPDLVDKGMLQFLLQTRVGFKKTVGLEHSGPNGGPIKTLNLSRLTDAQLMALLDIRRAAGEDIEADEDDEEEFEDEGGDDLDSADDQGT